MSTNEQKYRTLDPNEVIQEGDECRYQMGKWYPCSGSIGATPKDWSYLEFRRPIPAPEPKEGGCYARCPECGHLNDGHFADRLKPTVDSLRARAETAERDEALKAHSSECRAHGTTIAKRDRLQAELEAIKNASGQFEPHHNFKTVIDGIHHMRHKIGEFTHQITSLQAELAKCREALKPLDAIAERLATQDNRITAHPMFCVQIKVRDVGYDASYCDSKCWHDSANCETVYDDDKDFQEPSGKEWDEFGYRDRWETVMVAFTEKGCEDYLSIDGHNVRHRAFRGEVRIYVESYNRCWEMIEIREALLRQAKAAREGGK